MSLRGPLSRFRIYTTARTYASVLADVLRFRTHRGDAVARLEDQIRELVGVPYVVCVPQARVGIFLAIRTLIKPGQKIVLSPYTIYDVINMVICAGGIPVFADIDSKTCNIDPAEVEKLIDIETGAVLITHLHGLAADVEALAALCRKKGVPLVEDAAQAFGSRVHGQYVGSFGDAGIFSFGMYKNLNTFYGGMVVTRREDVYHRLHQELAAFPLEELGHVLKEVFRGLMTDVATWPPLFRYLTFPLFRFGSLHDIKFLNQWVRVEDNSERRQTVPNGYLHRMRPTQARLGLQGLPRVQEDTRARIAHARCYHEGLQDLDSLRCPPFREDGSHIYTYYPIQYKDRHGMVAHLMRAGCDLAVQHLKNCADLPCFKEFYQDCPRARVTANETILLPTYPRYSRQDVKRNIAHIRAFLRLEENRS